MPKLREHRIFDIILKEADGVKSQHSTYLQSITYEKIALR